MSDSSYLSKYPALVVFALALAGCGGTLEDTIDDVLPKKEPLYKSSKSLPPLEVPPDLSQTTLQDSYSVPSASGTTYSEYSATDQQTASIGQQQVLAELTNVRVEREGDKRWLVVKAPPGQVWPKIREFWLEQGFILEVDDPRIGIMETNWAEKRADFKTGFMEKLMSKLSTALYGSATRDKFRTRLERGDDPNLTEVYISHRGAEEIRQTVDSRTGEVARAWQPRPSDPELEAEMLNRMMISFGVGQQRAGELIAQSRTRKPRAQMVRARDGTAELALEEGFSRAWRRTGLALDRVGFTVEDRDRSRGLFFVRYVDPNREANEKSGFLSKLKFWESEDAAGDDAYLISLKGAEGLTRVVVLDKQGQRDASDTATRILSLLHEQLK